MLHPIKWIKAKWNAYLDYDENWDRDYKRELESVPETVHVRPRWGQPDPEFDYLFAETRPMRRLEPDGTVLNHSEVTVTFNRVRPLNQNTEEMPQTEWVRQVLGEMDAEFRGRLMADPIDETDPVYNRRHRQAINAAAMEDRLRFQQMYSPDWNDDWSEYLKSDVASIMVKRALHASDRGAADTMTMERIRV